MSGYPPPSSPIGIFDSGIGGLTVAQAIRRELPNESLVYFGDTTHLPYGDKSAASIRGFGTRIGDELVEQGCKAIVIACNTASSFAEKQIRAHIGEKALVMGVISPIAEYLSKKEQKGPVGVIGTKGTIRSRVYVRSLRKMLPDVRVISRSTPLLAPMIEEGFYNNNISRTIIHSYLDVPAFKDIDTLVLGCTHYPLIKDEISEFYKGQVEIVDPAEVVAISIGNALQEKGLLSRDRKSPDHFMVSDKTEAFENSTRSFFGDRLELEEKRIWDQEE